MGAASAVPYTSLEEMRMKRSTGRSRIASRRICVPATFVVTNSEPPSAIDFSTCDLGAAACGRAQSRRTSLWAHRVDVLVESALREAGIADGRRREGRGVDVVRYVRARLVDVEAVRVVVCARLARIRTGHEAA